MSRAGRHVALRQLGTILVFTVLGVVIGRATVSAADQPDGSSGALMVAPTELGAARAAIAYLDALRWDVLVDDAARRRTIDARATPKAAAELDAELAAPAEALRSAVSEPPVVARSAVLGFRVKTVVNDRAVVRIWGMSLFATGAYEPATQWSTSDVALVWSGDRWLVDGIQSSGGPTPSSPLRALARQARTLQEVRHVP